MRTTMLAIVPIIVTVAPGLCVVWKLLAILDRDGEVVKLGMVYYFQIPLLLIDFSNLVLMISVCSEDGGGGGESTVE